MVGRPGASFEEADVVENYPYRPPYPGSLFEKLIEIAPRLTSLLDIGCGPGKVSRPLASRFETATAVDPSRQMIALGKSLEDGDRANIRWIEGFAEDFPLGEERFDLTVAAASIHWMDHERLFPRLGAHASPGHVFAAISGDTPFEPPWEADWHGFLGKWVPALTDQPFDPGRKAEEWESYTRHLEIEGREYFLSAPFEQSIEDFIRCQHSRDTFAPSKLGADNAVFDAELAEMLRPYAAGGRLTFIVRSKLVWGAIKIRSQQVR
ncbi:2-polyprenyl-3-methyl-5-hydroxy-6-metoxy-1, 4-benzoquinol methylase [Neorhizobium galegae bv. officinalis]|uniref:2-polyprenyl-3-methyl-5-hydroxy-6-metoxy-1, 4-benzoquinol methylase n=1 Tax=Neorhizobium galegae bv. officinalis TaxID=323656 RepID=A0A0T7F8L1_NEOGA|nr:class I SAM-dependent methyltransferase [Neorhizobium galegae]CDZ31279.1 2-polyprenyl-3-methyl-5-hydroxy-6-metoxy-1, 4-benzoquinol methylase [Neorhizobium galegae bv. officinalis]